MYPLPLSKQQIWAGLLPLPHPLLLLKSCPQGPNLFFSNLYPSGVQIRHTGATPHDFFRKRIAVYYLSPQRSNRPARWPLVYALIRGVFLLSDLYRSEMLIDCFVYSNQVWIKLISCIFDCFGHLLPYICWQKCPFSERRKMSILGQIG